MNLMITRTTPTFTLTVNHRLFDLGPPSIHQRRGFRKTLHEGVGTNKDHSVHSLARDTLAVNRTVRQPSDQTSNPVNEAYLRNLPRK